MATGLPKLEIVNEVPNGTKKLPETLDVAILDSIWAKQRSSDSDKTGANFLDNEKLNADDTGNADHQDEPDKDPQKAPLASPEMDDVDGETTHLLTPFPFGGMDDDFFDPNKNTENDVHDGSTETMGDYQPGHKGETGVKDELIRMGGDEPNPPPPPPPVIIQNDLSSVDVNSYQRKKNLAQGMMDLALLSANANQLRYVLESTSTHPYYYPSLALITLSIIFQIAVGVGLIMNSQYDVTKHHQSDSADQTNDWTVLGVFLITIVNVFITSFSVASPTTVVGVAVSQPTG